MGNTNPNAKSKAKGGFAHKKAKVPTKSLGQSGPKKGKTGSGYNR